MPTYGYSQWKGVPEIILSSFLRARAGVGGPVVCTDPSRSMEIRGANLLPGVANCSREIWGFSHYSQTSLQRNFHGPGWYELPLLGHVLLLKNVGSMLLGENELSDYASLIWNWTRNVMLKGAVHFFL